MPVVLSDIGNVLINANNMIPQATEYAALTCSKKGFEIDPPTFKSVYLEVDKKTDRPHVNHLFGDFQIAVEATTKIFGKPHIVYAGCFVAYYREYIRQQIIPQDDETTFFRVLYESHALELGIISDGTTGEQLETLARLDIARYLNPDIVLISEMYGEEKVNENIYRETLKRAQVEPGQAIMIGDNLERDIQIPQRIGMKTIFFSKYVGMEPLSRYSVKPDYICKNFIEVLHIVKNVFKI